MARTPLVCGSKTAPWPVQFDCSPCGPRGRTAQLYPSKGLPRDCPETPRSTLGGGWSAIRRTLLRVAGCLLAVSSLTLLPAPPASAAVPPTVGLNVKSFWNLAEGTSTEADVHNEFAHLKEVGADVTRMPITWNWVEAPEDDQYKKAQVQRLDVVFDAARDNDVKVLALILGTPCWATSDPNSQITRLLTGECQPGFGKYPPEDPAKFGEFAAWLRTNYGNHLAGIEVWNEANNPGSFKGTAADYVDLVKAANSAVTDVAIMAGALHCQPSTPGGECTGEHDYMRRLYDAGILGHYDVWTDHSYAPTVDAFIQKVQAVRAVQQKEGDTTDIWVDEFGWSTCERCKTEEKQATLLPAAFETLGNLEYVAGANTYELRDRGTDPTDPEDNFGILRRDFSRKPAFDKVKSCLTTGVCD